MAIATEFLDLEPMLATIEMGRITAVALAHDLEIVDAMIELDAGSEAGTSPRASARFRHGRRIGIGNVEQQAAQRRYPERASLRGASRSSRCLPMKAVVASPAANSGCRRQAARNA